MTSLTLTLGYKHLPGQHDQKLHTPKKYGSFSTIPDDYKNSDLRNKLDAYMRSHDISPDDFVVNGNTVKISGKPPRGWGKKYAIGRDWYKEVNAAISKSPDGYTLNISQAMIEEHPEFVLHEIGHLVWAENGNAARSELKMANQWYSAERELAVLARDNNLDALKDLGTRIYESVELTEGGDPRRGISGVPTGKFVGRVNWDEAFADMFTSWRLGGQGVRTNISKFVAKHGMDAEVLFGDKRHDPIYKKEPKW